MKFSQLTDVLKYKYRNGEDPKEVEKRKKRDYVFYSAAAVLLITAIVLNVFASTGRINNNQGEHTGAMPTPDPKVELVSVDRSMHAKKMTINEKRINQPSIYGHEMLFSAGSGSLESAVLDKLYLFDAITGKAEVIASSQLKGGEIFETYLSENWIVWVDTDHKGKNVIYKMNRVDINGIKAKTVSIVQEAENHMPRLGLYGNYLVWMEQISDKEDQLYFVDLTTDENMSLKLFESTNYAISTPYIFKDMVLWADNDPSDETNTKSAIHYVVFEDLGVKDDDVIEDETEEPEEDDSGILETQVFATGTYVHKPICNDDIFVWIDKNNAPDSTLYFAYKSGAHEPKALWDNITQYSVGKDFIAFVSNQIVYAYYYKSDILLQISSATRSAILPQAFGTLIVWEDKTDGGDDMFMYSIME